MRLPNLQLSFRTLILLIAFAAFTSYLIHLTSISAAPFCIWLVALVSLPAVWWFSPPDPPTRAGGIAFLILLLTAVAAELYAAHLAYYTMGEIDQLVYILAIGLNIFHMAIYFKYCKYAIVLTVLLWISLVPYQLVLRTKWIILDREMRSIIAIVEAHRARTGAYPPNLDAITTGRRSIAGEISYSLAPMTGGFHLSYNLGSENTAHTYDSTYGHFYYPD